MKGRIISLLLFVSMLAPLASTYFSFHHQKKQVRREVKWKMIAGLEKEELVLLKFTEESQKELHWEHAKEFEFRGQMYDIVDKATKGDTTYFWCWWDHKETALNKKLDLLLAKIYGNNQHKKESRDKSLTFYQKLFCKNLSNSLTIVQESHLRISLYKEEYSTITISPPVPPPRTS